MGATGPGGSARRRDVWLVDFGEPVGHEQGYRRPSIVVSHDRLNESRAGLVIVVPVTRSRRGLPSHIEIEPAESGLDSVSYAKVEDLKSVSTDRLVRRFGAVSPVVIGQIAAAARLLLDL